MSFYNLFIILPLVLNRILSGSPEELKPCKGHKPICDVYFSIARCEIAKIKDINEFVGQKVNFWGYSSLKHIYSKELMLGITACQGREIRKSLPMVYLTCKDRDRKKIEKYFNEIKNDNKSIRLMFTGILKKASAFKHAPKGAGYVIELDKISDLKLQKN